MKQKFNDYYLGLDIGTNSVGWAVTSTDYDLIKFNKKWMHGVRLFEEMQTAQGRRTFRSSRRRLNRRKYRINTLDAYFENEIMKIDPTFFERIQDSSLHLEDKQNDEKYVLFADKDYTDVDYYKAYETIYHLRKDLMETKAYRDIRLVYLAVHHILKYRGNFLYEGEMNVEGNIEHLVNELSEITEQLFGEKIYENIDVNEYGVVLVDKMINKTKRTSILNEFISADLSDENKKRFEEVHKLISARKVNLENIFTELDLDKISIQLDASNIDETLDTLTGLDESQMRVIEISKAIYDWSVLKNIIKDHASISDAMVSSYTKHGEHLALLRSVVKPLGKKIYNTVFNDDKQDANYVAYIGNATSKENKSTATQDDFYKFIKKIISDSKDNKVQEILNLIDTSEFMPKQRVSSNGVIPHQLHLLELTKILDNAAKHHPFLNEIDESTLSVKDRLIEIFKFRIPYYIGPLNDSHKLEDGGFAWVKRLKYGKVYPWNFEEMIDVDKTAEDFITNMTNDCTYLLEAKVVPKSSLLYQKFMVLNEINNIKINGDPISVSLKQKIYEGLFEKQNKIITKKRIESWLKANEPDFIGIEIEVTGVDSTLTTKLAAYHKLLEIFEGELPDESILEDLIYWSTLFSDAKDILEQRIIKHYGAVLDKDQVKKFVRHTFVGWGNLSREFLEELVDVNSNMNIIQSLYETNNNLMELLSTKFSFSKQIENHNLKNLSKEDEVVYEMLDKLNIPPNVKRSVWQTIRITEEIKSITKREPKRIFIEMARGSLQKTGRTSSRKEQLLALYKSIDSDSELKASLQKQTDDTLRRRAIYLYYRQLGKCLYSGEQIDFGKLVAGSHEYDVDHIYPQSLTADDSLINLALVKRTENMKKSDNKLIHPDVQKKNMGLWRYLRDAGLMENETYNRLTRIDELTPEELSGFVARQLVETRQSTKAVLSLLKQLYPTSEVVTIKAQHIDRFRHENEFIKIRLLNDLHHAKDAYLAIVVGNVYFEKFTSDPRNYIKNSKYREYNLPKLIQSKKPGNDVFSRQGELVWESGVNGTIKTVKRVLDNNAILTTRLTTVNERDLFDQNPTKPSKNRIPLKKGKDPEKYGGYNNPRYSYYVLIERKRGKNLIKSLEPIPFYVAKNLNNKVDLLEYFESSRGYEDVRILMDKIPASNTLLEIDGSKNRITGVSGDKYVLRNEHQPFFNDIKVIQTLKKIEKTLNSDRKDIVEDFVTEDLDLTLAAVLNKFELNVHKKRLSKFVELANINKDKINDLSKNDKVDLILELLKLVKVAREASDLRVLGASKQSGINYLGRNLITKKTVFLINQSVTGLFENKVDLLNL